jgi:hypothetical protein
MCKGWRLPQHTLSEAYILKNGSKEMAAGGLVTFLLEFLQATELDACAPLRLHPGHARCFEIVGAVLDVSAEFLFHLPVDLRAFQ